MSSPTVVLVHGGFVDGSGWRGVYDALSADGYRTIVVSDGCSAGSEGAHNASLESLGLLAEIATTDELLTAVRTPATV